jgi:hypothetical protein
MPIPTYTPGYPPDGSSLGQTKAVIRNNLDGTFQTLGVDHVNNNGSPGSNPAGYHTVIHQVTQTGDPTTVTGVNQLYSKVVRGDTALFMKSGNGIVQQLSGAFTAGASGSVTLPGGIIMKWGVNSAPTSGTFPDGQATGTVTYATAFPGASFVVLTSMINDGTTLHSAGSTSVNTAGTTTGFSWQFASESSDYTGFYYLAIGN